LRAWIGPSVILILVISIFPFIIALDYSFRNISYTETNAKGEWNGLDNYRRALFDPDFIHSLGVTFKFMLPAIAIEMVIGLLIAMLFAKPNLKGINKAIPILLIPNIIAPVVAGLVGRLSLNTEFGVIGITLRKWGLIEQAILGDVRLALPAVIAIDVWQWTPFVAVIVLAGLLSLPKEPYEAAALDGAKGWKIFRRVTLPLISPLLAVVLLLRAIEAFKIFDTVWVMTGGGPGTATETSNIFAYRMNFMHWRLGYGAAIVLLLYAVSFTLCVIFFRYLNREQIRKEREVYVYADGDQENTPTD